MTLVIAHRGASADAPENTVAAFELAIEQNADMIETDLHLASCGRIPLYHDDEIGRVRVGALSLEQIRAKLPACPELEDVLDRFGARIPFNLELKGVYPGLVQRVLDAVRARGLLARTLFSSFEPPALRELRALEPGARIGVLADRRGVEQAEKLAVELRAEAVHPPRQRVSRELIERLHGAGFAVNTYTVDDLGEQRRLVDWGIDGIFTNKPAQLRALLGG
jgi:glycerophosphoryl diester phosphodiesterase